MKDLTQGSVIGNLVHMSAFLVASMVMQALYLLADMYWVGRLGKESVAAVGLAANLMALTLALTQMLGVGTTTLISHAGGVKDQSRASRVFNQSFALSVFAGGILCLLTFLFRRAYCQSRDREAGCRISGVVCASSVSPVSPDFNGLGP